jgi:hypothetical protein
VGSVLQSYAKVGFMNGHLGAAGGEPAQKYQISLIFRMTFLLRRQPKGLALALQ